MFHENLQIIQESFLRYKGTGMYMALFLVAILYIFLVDKNKKNKAFLVYFPCFILLVILNPIFHKFVNPFLNQNVYWRTFWLLPIGIVMAYAATNVIKNRENSKNKIFVFTALVFILMVSGKLIYNTQNYQKVNNFYKIPDEYVKVVDILSGIPIENKKAMTSVEMVPYIRQIDANIKLVFPRRAYGDYEKYEIIQAYNAGYMEKLIQLCNEKKVNILIFYRSIPTTTSPTYLGFQLYAQTENYDIYILHQN